MNDSYKAALDAVMVKLPGTASALRITSPETPRYNCVAFAAGDMSRWWWPDEIGIAFWPSGCLRLASLQAFQMAFETVGYELCGSSDYDPTKDRVAIFHKDHSPTHAARQIHPSGMWASKLGRWYDVEHAVEGVCGQCYGQIAFLMERTRRTT